MPMQKFASQWLSLPTIFILLLDIILGTECDQGVSQSCLQALSYLSVCIIPNHALAPCLHMLQRCITSSSYKTKLSTLEFLQTVVFTNFPSFVGNNEHRSKIINLTTSLLADSHIIVRQKAAKILGGLLHSGQRWKRILSSSLSIFFFGLLFENW